MDSQGRIWSEAVRNLTPEIRERFHHPDFHRILSTGRNLRDPIGFDIGYIHLGAT
jgi:hypothetical protein